MSKLTCPKDPEHKRFTAYVRATEDWIVDEQGAWVETEDTEHDVRSGPHFDTSNCVECLEDTVVEEEE